MRIKVINPNITWSMTREIEKTAETYARPETEITAVSPEKGPAAIESIEDEVAATPEVLKEIKKGIEEGYDGFIIACFLDPGLFTAREMAEAPVVGIGEASMLMACMLGRKFSILSPGPRMELSQFFLEFVKKYGLVERFASARGIGLGVLDLEKDVEKTKRVLIQEGTKAIVEDGGEVLLLGCAGMAGLDKALEKELKVPVIDGVVAAVKFLEAMHEYRKKTSKMKRKR